MGRGGGAGVSSARLGGWVLTSQAGPRDCTGEEGPERVSATWDRKPRRGLTINRRQTPSVLAAVSPCPVSFPCPPPGWWARPWCPGDAGQGPPHSPLRSLCPSLALAMARLAAALWSLCVTTVLVTSATQGRCWEGLGLQTQMGGWAI